MRRILWFRRDLRSEDNPLLSLEGEVLPIFIFDTTILQRLDAKDRRVAFIFEQVLRLKNSLKAMGLDLAVFYGDPVGVFNHLMQSFNADEVAASGDYDTYARSRDRDISHLLPFHFLHDTYIFRPDEVVKNDGTPYLVFTPFYKRSLALLGDAHLKAYAPAAQKLHPYNYEGIHCFEGDAVLQQPFQIESIGFTPVVHGISALSEQLESFKGMLGRYAIDRDFLALDGTSRLSVHLRFGTLGIRQLLRWLARCKDEGIDTEPFYRQLVFRDFYAYLLYHFPHLEHENFKYPFKGIENDAYYEAFCEGKTGVPIVDAGIRELLQSGTMHNRVRMICASFFTKDLLLPW